MILMLKKLTVYFITNINLVILLSKLIFGAVGHIFLPFWPPLKKMDCNAVGRYPHVKEINRLIYFKYQLRSRHRDILRPYYLNLFTN